MILAFLVACTPYSPASGDAANLTQVAMTVQAALHTPGPQGGLVPAGAAQQDPSAAQPAAPGAPAQGEPTPTRIPTKPAPPPQPNNQPAAPSQPAPQVSISNIGHLPENIVYFGFCSAGEAMQLGVHATLDPLDQIQEATLKYRFIDPNGMTFNGSEQMWLLGVGDYEGVIDAGIEGPLTLVDHDGLLEFWVEVKDKINTITNSVINTVTVGFCPGAVAQPPAANNQPANPGAAGGGSVKFINNSSHLIASLVIDNQEVILTEAQTIQQGGWLEVSGLDAGDHAYGASNGFWSGGSPQILLPLPVETFSGAPNQVTISDPSIYDLLTNYVDQGAFVGPILDGTGDFAGFCFYSNGSFDFYLNGHWVDNGTYSLDNRQPGIYAVKFTVINQAGTEQFVGTYFYAGAFAGLMQMDNSGRAGFEKIEYKRDSHCQ